MSEAVELHPRESPFQPTLPTIAEELGVFAVVFRRSGDIPRHQPLRFGEITDRQGESSAPGGKFHLPFNGQALRGAVIRGAQ